MAISRRLLRMTLFAAFLSFPLSSAAQIIASSGDELAAQEVARDMAFFAAGDLTVTTKSSDDIYAAGGDVLVERAQGDHLVIVGGDVSLSEAAFEDVIAAGGDLNFVSGRIADDLVAAGGDVNLQREFEIEGSAVVVGGDVAVASPIGGELRVTAQSLRLDAEIDGDMRFSGGQIFIEAGSRLKGDLHYRADKLTIAPDALIEGDVHKLPSPEGRGLGRWAAGAATTAALFAFALLVGMGVLIIVIAISLPALMNSAAQMMREKPLATLGVGFLAVFAAPLVIAALAASIFGIPLALLISVIFLAATPVALAAAAYFVGLSARRAFVRKREAPHAFSRAGWTALSALLLVILALIPMFGGLIWFGAYVFGMGAVMTRGGKALAMRA